MVHQTYCNVCKHNWCHHTLQKYWLQEGFRVYEFVVSFCKIMFCIFAMKSYDYFNSQRRSAALTFFGFAAWWVNNFLSSSTVSSSALVYYGFHATVCKLINLANMIWRFSCFDVQGLFSLIGVLMFVVFKHFVSLS